MENEIKLIHQFALSLNLFSVLLTAKLISGYMTVKCYF